MNDSEKQINRLADAYESAMKDLEKIKEDLRSAKIMREASESEIERLRAEVTGFSEFVGHRNLEYSGDSNWYDPFEDATFTTKSLLEKYRSEKSRL
jgi:hypothetical protein